VDFDSAAKAERALRKGAEELTRTGYREFEWVPEPAIDRLISQFGVDTVCSNLAKRAN